MVATPFLKPVFPPKKWKTFIGSYRYLPRKIKGFSVRWRLAMQKKFMKGVTGRKDGNLLCVGMNGLD
jgi:hypothetical protein